MQNIEKWVDELSPSLYRYFLGRFNESVASDLVQETLMRLWEKRDILPSGSSQKRMTMYAFGIARNVRKEAIRKNLNEYKKAQASYEDRISNEDDVLDEVSMNEKIRQLRQAMSMLKEIEREVLLLQMEKALSMEEISELVDLPVGTVKSHLHRGKQHIKQIISHTSLLNN